MANKSTGLPFDWQTKVLGLIPEWDLMDHVATTAMTLQDLASHRSGLPKHFGAVYSQQDGVEAIVRTSISVTKASQANAAA